jgi:hypothetical protein
VDIPVHIRFEVVNEAVDVLIVHLGGHPNPANGGHLKTGQ